MSDGSSGTTGFIAEMKNAVVEPVKDEMGKLVEVGVSAVSGKAQDPQQVAKAQQQKQQDEQKRMLWAKATIERYRKLDDEMQRLRMQKQQNEQQRQQTEAQEKQQKDIDLQKRQQLSNQVVKDAQTRTEAKKGVGG